jgi:integrase
MPLKLIRRHGNPVWYARGTVRRQTIYESTGTTERERAEAYRAKREAQLWDNSVFGARATVSFAHAVESYLITHPPRPTTVRLVSRLLDHFGTTPLHSIDQSALDRAYAVLLTSRAGNATKLRAVLTPLNAILEHAARRKWCDRPAFERPKQPKSRIAFLRPDEARALIAAASPHIRPLLVFLICTGARMSEALELDWADVDLRAGRVLFARTKTGHERRADLPPAAIAALATLPHRAGRVFIPPAKKGRRAPAGYADFDRSSGGQIKTAWHGAIRRAGLQGEWINYQSRADKSPKRRWVSHFHPHDLRHTWATWHYAIHRDMLRLRIEGGWRSVSQVEIYAHALPETYRTEAAAFLEGTPADKVSHSA